MDEISISDLIRGRRKISQGRFEYSGQNARPVGRISKSIQYMVTCGSCGNLDDFAPFSNQREAEAHYRSLGWSKTDGSGWICPECSGR